MGTLKRAGLVGQNGAGETVRYYFRHVLMRDAAYDSMLRPERRSLHQQVATALQAKFPELCEAEPETLAHHLTHGAEPRSRHSALAQPPARGRRGAAAMPRLSPITAPRWR